jgi:hypothetical protein
MVAPMGLLPSSSGQSFSESPHTFIFWLFRSQALLTALFSGLIILQNKWKGDRDFLVQTQMYQMLRAHTLCGGSGALKPESNDD